ncbi:MAG: acyl-CoA dehydrogenase family protein [Proteobacteria bacterium]|jgi:acyl-CoA dehydrogenase|nr:acyl-CoA dehydrogenase family protein [Pseudomonadota bacterium]
MNPYHSPWMTADHELYRDTVRRFIETEFVPSRERWIEQGRPEPEAWAKAGAVGMLLPDVPAEYGGGGGDFGFDVITYEELSRACISSFGNGIQSIVAHYLVRYGTEAQKHKWLPGMASGEIIASIAMTEPGTGSDLQAVKTRAQRDGDEYVLNGAKTFITNGYNANLICVVCKTDPEARAKGISLLMVEVDALDGFRRNKPLKKVGMKGQDTCELFFDDVRVPVENILGGVEGQGFYQLMAQLPRERLIIGVSAVAAMEAVLEGTIDYCKQRKAFGQTLLDFQNTKFKLAELKTETKIARVFLDHCIEQLNAGTLDNETASMAKWWCSEKQFETAHQCLQLHGGYGYMLEYPVAHYFADARVQMIYGGSNEIMKELIGRSL